MYRKSVGEYKHSKKNSVETSKGRGNTCKVPERVWTEVAGKSFFGLEEK